MLPLFLGAGPPVVKSVNPAADLDSLFERTDGWIGGGRGLLCGPLTEENSLVIQRHLGRKDSEWTAD
jgi:hypothetical protein